MKILIIATALTALALAALAALTAPQMHMPLASEAARRSLYFESHGRDDLREWPAAIVKGARYLKVDFNFQPDPYTCAVQTRLLANNDSSVPAPRRFPNGCFVLCHYYRNSTRDFSTTIDLVDMLGSASMASLLSALPDAQQHGLVVQMCLKNKPALSCTNATEDAAKWIGLYDAFHAAVAAAPAPAVPVRYVFDSLGYDESCYFGRWPRFSSTYTGSAPQAAHNNSGASAEFQMVNMAAAATANWDYLGAGDFFKFVNATYAFVAWEPANQATIAKFMARYLGYGVIPAHEPGMLIAYNGDPALFHVYTANVTGQHSNVPVGSANSENPSVSYVDAWGILISCASQANLLGSASGRIECTALARGKNARFTPVASALADGSSAPCPDGVSFVFPSPLIDSISVDDRAATAAPNGPFPFFIAAGLSAARGTVSRAADGTIMFNVTGMATIFVNSSAIAPQLTAGALRVTPNRAGNGTYTVSAAIIGAGPDFPVIAVVACDVALPVSGVLIVNPTSHATLAAQAFGSPQAAAPSDASIAIDAVPNGESGEVFVMAVWSGARSVDMAAAMMNINGGGDAEGGVTSSWTAGPAKVGVGRSPSIHVGRDSTIAIAYGDSFCYNTELVDDDILLFWGQKVCNLQDAEVFEVLPNPVLSYVTGNAAAVLDLLHAGNVHRNGFATVCNEYVLHGTFDLGYAPGIAAVPKDSARFGDDSLADGASWLVAAAQSLAVEDLVCSCGTPVSHGGRIVVDAFPARGFYNRTAVAALQHAGL